MKNQHDIVADTNTTDRRTGTRQFGHCGTGGCKWKTWARKSANRISRREAKQALKNYSTEN